MTCTVNITNIKNGIEEMVKKDLLRTGVFNQDLSFENSIDAKGIADGINRRLNETVLRKVGNKYVIKISDFLAKDYFFKTQTGKDIRALGPSFENEYFQDSPNKGTAYSWLNFPEVSDITYDNLIKLLKSINPKFRVEEVDNLPSDGLTQLKELLVSVRTLSKHNAISEEVAHVVFELIPDDDPLKIDMIKNITSYPIYGEVYRSYGSRYSGNIDKIKREAIAKLISGYISAISNDNKDLLNKLNDSNKGFLKRWYHRLLRWLGIGLISNSNGYFDLATDILSGDIKRDDWKDVSNISVVDSYWFKLSNEELFNNTENVMDKVDRDKLNETITQFAKNFSKIFNKILHSDVFKELNDELKRSGNSQSVDKINRLSEVHQLFSEANKSILQAKMNDVFDTKSYIMAVKQFLEAIDSMDILTDAIIKVINNKKVSTLFQEAINNINELDTYMSLYKNFDNLISKDMLAEFNRSGVATDVIDSISRIRDKFRQVNDRIIASFHNDVFTFYKHQMANTNSNILNDLNDDLKRENARPNPSQKIIKSIEDKIEAYIQTDDKILSVLSGKSKDIDPLSVMNHLFNAAITNGDMYVASVAKYANGKIEKAQAKAQLKARGLYVEIEKLEKIINKPSHEIGAKISFVDKVYDRATKSAREVLTWLNPHKDIRYDLDRLFSAYIESKNKYFKEDKNSSEKQKLKDIFIKNKDAYNSFVEKYMNRPFVKEYYNYKKKYEDNPDFVEIKGKYDELSEEISALEKNLRTEPNNESLARDIAMLSRERSQMFNLLDQDGFPKEGEELKKVQLLKDYFDEGSKFKEDDIIQTEIVFNTYQNKYKQTVDYALKKVEDQNPKDIKEVEELLRKELNDQTIRIETLYELNKESNKLDYTLVSDILMDKWDSRNIFNRANNLYYEDMNKIFEELEKLQKRGDLTDLEEEEFQLRTAKKSIIMGSRDGVNEINPDALTDEQKADLINIDNRLLEIKDQKPKSTLVLKEMKDDDKIKYQKYIDIINDPVSSKSEVRDAKKRKRSLENKYIDTQLAEKKKKLFAQLGEMRTMQATQYYWQKVEMLIQPFSDFLAKYVQDNKEYIKDDEVNDLYEIYNLMVQDIDEQYVESLELNTYNNPLFEEFLDYLDKNNHELYRWFVNSHIDKTKWSDQIKDYIKFNYTKNSIYEVMVPTDPKHIERVYNKKFRRSRVKNEYRTGYDPTTGEVNLKVGEHVTNRDDNGFKEFLPLTPEQGAPKDSPYINHEYYRLRDSKNEKDIALFKYMNLLRDTHLAEQDKLASELRSWNNVPIAGLTDIEEKLGIPSKIKEKLNVARSLFGKKNDQADAINQTEGLDTYQEVNQITYKFINESIPKLGMSAKLDPSLVSKDLLRSVLTFIFRAHEFEARTEVQPVMKAIIDVMKNSQFTNPLTSNKERINILEKIYSQKILQEVPDGAANSEMMKRITRILTRSTSFRLLADVPGGVINFGSAITNNMIEAFSGRYLGPADYIKGTYLGFRVNMHMLADYYKKTDLSYYNLLNLEFDFIQGDFEEDLLDRSSNLNKNASISRVLMIPRKVGELSAQIAMGMGILEKTKVPNSIDGKSYPVHEIYKKNSDGNLILKDGFPKEWEIGGQKMIQLKELINRVNLELHGNYAKINQSEASRHSIGKLAENMKRWFAIGISRRFGRENPDITYENITEGYYVTAFMALKNIFVNAASLNFTEAKNQFNYYIDTPRYKENLKRFGAESTIALSMFLIYTFLLGYGGDDKNKELDKNSWLHNLTIMIMLRLFSETTAYNPIPGLGFQELKRNALSPIALPADAVSNMAGVAQLGLYHILSKMGMDSLDSELYYTKNSGYWYAQKGNPKVLKYALKTAGYTGYTLEPNQYIKDFSNLQSRLK